MKNYVLLHVTFEVKSLQSLSVSNDQFPRDLSGGYILAFLYFDFLPSEYLWGQYIYTIGGGYTVLQIAMYGYIGDVTKNS